MKVIRAWKFVLPLGLLVLTAGCSKESSQTQPVTTKTENATTTAPPAKEAKQHDKALVRVVNAVPGGPTFDIYADNQKVFDSVSFKTVTLSGAIQ